ncbi:MAG: hypothetical protein AB1724_18600 [Thermodesulfobacteriota bacterium]
MKKILFILFICLGMAANTGAVELSGGELHGFISQGYLNSSDNNFLAHDTEDGTMEYMEMGINYNKWLTPGLSAGFQLFAKDLGKAENQEVKLDWAMLNYRWKPWLGAKAGRMKMKTGLYNDTRDIDMVRPWALLPQSVYLEYFRDPSLSIDGGDLYGTVPADGVGSFSYEIQYGTQDLNPDRDSAMTLYIEDVSTFVPDKTDDYDVDSRSVFNLEWAAPLEGLVIGGSYNDADMSMDSHFTEDTLGGPPLVNVNTVFDPVSGATTVTATVTTMAVNAGDRLETKFKEWEQTNYYIKYTWKNLELSGECFHQDQKQEITINSTGDVIATTDTTVIPAAGPPTTTTTVNVLGSGWTDSMTTERESLGYYVAAAYRFCDWFQLGGYYSAAYPDKNDKDGDDLEAAGKEDYQAWLKDICVTLRFDVTANWAFKLEEHFMDGAAYLNPEDNDDLKQHWTLTVAKASYMF